MMAGRLGEDARAMDNSAAFGIFGTESKRLEPRYCNRPGAHRTGLQRDPQGAVVEARCSQLCGRCPDRLHLGMGGGIV